jgi:nucleoid-associated protein YgaU
MHKRFCPHLLTTGLCLLLAWGTCGCNRSAASLDQIEERDPLMRRALAREGVQDIDGAIDLYNKALDRKPSLGRAHLKVALLYDAQKQDYVRAIYHYQRYLELRPKAEKRKLIEDLIRQSRLSFAASLPHQPGGAVEEIAALKREIELLRSQIQPGEGTKGVASSKKPAAASGEPQPPKPIPAKPAVETYTVQPGDTLSSIATKMYKDSGKWNTIFDANRGMLVSPESVRVGQTLVIPR